MCVLVIVVEMQIQSHLFDKLPSLLLTCQSFLNFCAITGAVSLLVFPLETLFSLMFTCSLHVQTVIHHVLWQHH